MFHYSQISGQPRQRHWLTAILSAAPAVISTGTAIAGQGNSKDQQRFKTAQDWYQQAVTGDVDALNALKFMSGRFGAGTCGRFGACSGFATQVAKDYSYKLYEQALQTLQGILPQGVPVPTTPAATTPGPVNVQATIGGPSGSGVTIQTPNVTTQVGSGAPPTTQQRTTNTLLWVLVGVVVLGGVAVYMTRKRG